MILATYNPSLKTIELAFLMSDQKGGTFSRLPETYGGVEFVVFALGLLDVSLPEADLGSLSLALSSTESCWATSNVRNAPIGDLGQTLSDQCLSNVSGRVLDRSKKVVSVLSDHLQDHANLTLKQTRLNKELGLMESNFHTTC